MVVTGEGVMSPVCVCVCARARELGVACGFTLKVTGAPCAGPSQKMVMVVAYLGDFRNGVFEGEGRLWMSGGAQFCGEFRAGQRQGWGCEAQVGTRPIVGSFVDGSYVSGLSMASIC